MYTDDCIMAAKSNQQLEVVVKELAFRFKIMKAKSMNI